MHFADTLYIADTDPAADKTTPRRWWTGSEDLVFEGHTWRGSAAADGSGALMEVGDISQTMDIAGQRTVVRLAMNGESIRHALSVDLGAVPLEIGTLYSEDEGRTWLRAPWLYSGRLSEMRIVDGVLEASLETFLGDLERSNPLWWSHATQIARAPGDNAFAQSSELAADYELRWPPSR